MKPTGAADYEPEDDLEFDKYSQEMSLEFLNRKMIRE